jgi:protease IV
MEIKIIKNKILSWLKKFLDKSIVTAFAVGIAVMFGIGYFNLFQFQPKDPCAGKNVGIVKLTGEINTAKDPEFLSVSAPETIQQIEEFDANPDIKAIILDISSPGGSMEPSERIMLAIQRTTKPVIAVIEDVGASGAYLIASASERIFVSRLSETGSIGVTRDFLDISEKDKREGVIFYNFASGIYKGAEKEHGTLTQAQHDLIMENLMKMHNVFVEYVAKNRNIPIEKVKLLATGRTFLGDDALKNGLADQIGGMYEVQDWLRDKMGEDVNSCTVGE